MGFLCFHKHGRQASATNESPPKPRSAAWNTLRDGHRSASLSARIPADATEFTESVPNPDPTSAGAPALLRREGLSQLGIHVANIESRESYNFDVVAIHGLNGHPYKTWACKVPDGEVFWLNDFLPKALPGARIFTYGYDSESCFSTSTGDIRSYANSLLDCLEEARSEPSQISRPLVFICHSLGGLVCKESLIIANEKRECYQSILESTKAIFFFGTPHRGSDSADMILGLTTILKPFDSGVIELVGGKGKVLRRDLLKEISPRSKDLNRLCSSFVERASKIPCIVTFHELNKFRGRLIVSEMSATVGIGHERVVPLPGNHMQICQFRDEDEEAYKRILVECRKIGTDMSGRSRLLSPTEKQCMESLADPNERDFLGSRIDPARYTCEWILSIQQFQTWRNGLPPLLWISGHLGCGKTTLMSFLRHRMLGEDTTGQDTGSTLERTYTVCSFFCDERNRQLTNATNLLRGLIWDIVSQRHDLIHHVLEDFQPSRLWSYNKLWRIFEALLQGLLDSSCTGSVCVIIDALDECERKDRFRFLRSLAGYLGMRKHPSSRINFVLSSRSASSGDLEGLKENASHFLLDTDASLRKHMAADIRRFVLDDLLFESQFFLHEPGRSVKIEALADTIVTKSEGSFLWTSLILEGLHARSFIELADVESFLSECPPDLYGIYYESLAKVHPSRQEAVVKSLHILLAAKRPLTVAEFKTAMAVEKQHRTLEALRRSIEEKKNLMSYIEDILDTLVRIDESGVTLRHHAVKDFLLNGLASRQDSRGESSLQYDSNICSTFGTSMYKAENTMGGCCINFLNIQDFDKSKAEDSSIELWEDSGFGAISWSPESTPKSQELFPKSSRPISHESHHGDEGSATPFFTYAASNWGFHYASSNSADEELINAALKLTVSTNILANWSHQFRRSYWGYHDLPDALDALIVAAYFGQVQIVKKLISINKFRSNRGPALTWAARMGHGDVVKLLVKLEVSCMEHLVDGRSALSWAAAGGFLEIVDMLLTREKGLINVRDAAGCCLLTLAMENQHLEMVRWLLDSKDIDVNSTDKSETSPLSYAIGGLNPSAMELEVFQCLLHDLRTDLTLRNKRGRSCLSYLAEYGATEAIREILICPNRQDAIAKLMDDAGDNEGLSPLSRAARMGHVSTVRLLCETAQIGTQLSSIDKLDGGNVFDLAAKCGHAKIIEELGKHYQIGVNGRDRTGRTPLSTAMWGTNADVLRKLLDCGADVNIPDFNGKTPLAFGIRNIEFVKVLVEEYSADLNLPDECGRTSLWWARDDEILQSQLRSLGARG